MKPMTGVWKEVDDFVRQQYIPIHMMVEVSRKCNINCVHCYNIKDKAHLSLEQLDDIFSQLREAGTLFITLTGGEIFARTDADEVLYLAKSHGFDVRMITNGTMITKEKALVLKDIEPTEVGVSVLGGCPETHDSIARVPGAFDRTIQGIKNCIEVGVPVHIKCTLMNDNVKEYKQVIKIAKDLGIVYMIDPIVSPRDDGDTKNLKHRLSNKLIEEFYMEEFKTMTFDEDEDEGPEREKGLPCDAGTGFGAISADGSIYPCIQMPKKVGNILEERFKDVWAQSTVLNRLRNVSKDEFGRCDGCSGACSRCPGLAYLETGDMFGPSSIACFIGGLFKKFQAEQRGETYTPEPCGEHCTCH